MICANKANLISYISNRFEKAFPLLERQLGDYTKRAQKRVKDETVENEERSLVERRTWTNVEDEGDEIQELEKRLR